MANATNTLSTPRRFIKRQEVESITGLSCTEIYRRVAADNFPKQVTLGPKCVVWIEAEVLAWCDERIAECRGEPA
ncbi:helix-turn-helix transcriptional regulator [Pseudomonas laurylsulfatiphila]|uniref:helix-turn-helix transcriptional regulator n=1 Tax=Pseudomonas laurylsulfatiphila TaxID=2011015 RepID=UPI003D223A99